MRFSHTLHTWDGKTFPLTQDMKDHIEANIKMGKKLIYPNYNDPDDFVQVNNIKGVYRIRYTEPEMNEARQLPQGERKFDPNGPGYKKFLAARARLVKKMSMKNDR